MLPTTPPQPGLTNSEARRRLRNSYHVARRFSSAWRYLRIVLVIVFTPLNTLILSLALLLWWFGAWRDALLTAGVVCANAVVSIVQAIRAIYTLQRISLRNAPSVLVWRDEKLQTIQPDHVVVDDVMLLREGDQVVADGSILASANLQIDESMYTGEHDARAYAVTDTLRAGSTCVMGSAWYKITSQTDSLQLLTAISQRIRHLDTPLSRTIQKTVNYILLIAFLLIGVVMLRDIMLSTPWLERLQHATVMAGLIPNALILALTLSYALAAMAMSRARVLVQQLPAVEAVASIDTICIDKTGTLTNNTLELRQLHPCCDDLLTSTHAVARFVRADVAGNRTNEAIMHALAHLDVPVEHVVRHVPFDSARKWSMQVTAQHTWVLGAPDVLAPHLTHPVLPHFLAEAFASGARVLLLARCHVFTTIDDDMPILPNVLQPYVIVVLQETIRADAVATIANMRQAGVNVYVLSGDDPHAVQSIARRVGITADVALHAQDFFRADATSQFQLLRQTSVVGRLTPFEKAEIVNMLHQQGRRVAMVGDGFNDIPALKEADVAVVVQSARAAVRGIADVVLLNDQLDGLLHLRSYGNRINQRMMVVLHHFVIRVALSALSLVCGLVLGDVIWGPIDSSFLALFGVVLPSVLLIVWPQISYLPWLSDWHKTWLFLAGQLCGVIVISCVTAWWMPSALSTVLWWWCILSLWGRLGLGIWMGRLRTKDEPVTHDI